MTLPSVSLSSFYSVVQRTTALSLGLLNTLSSKISSLINSKKTCSNLAAYFNKRSRTSDTESGTPIESVEDSGKGLGSTEPASGISCEVRYLPERKRYSLLTLTPRDFTGVLTASDNVFHFESKSDSGAKVELDFDPEESIINYQKGGSFWDHGMSWCVIESNGERHYFTSDLPSEGKKHSQIISDSSRSTDSKNLEPTIALYQALTDRYLK